MKDDSQNNIGSERLVEFLTEDLKETGEYLRETDRKLSFLIQAYTGAFLLIATLSVNNIITRQELRSETGLVLVLIFIFFTGWLYVFSLRCKETKQMYIHRMNFLRREMHYFLSNKNYDLAGYWTTVDRDEPKAESEAGSHPSRKTKPRRVGLDDLYPNALRYLLFILCAALAYIATRIAEKYSVIGAEPRPQFLLFLTGSLISIVIVSRFTRALEEENEQRIEHHKEIYTPCSEKRANPSPVSSDAGLRSA
jgi:hypothetical protein